MIPWHRLLGVTLTHFFSGSCFRVHTEKDLSMKRQLLDVLVVTGDEVFPRALPDGFEGLQPFNLISFKSLKDTMSPWALDELLGHYVNLCKIMCEEQPERHKEVDFALYAISMRFPRDLALRYELMQIQSGVYDIIWGSRRLRLLVLSEMPAAPHNAIWNIFSGISERVAYGAAHLNWEQAQCSTVLNQLFTHYSLEGIRMSYTLEDFERDVRKEQFSKLPLKEQVEFATQLPEKCRVQIASGLSEERRAQIASGLSEDWRAQIASGLSEERRAQIASGLSEDWRAQIASGLPPEVLKKLLEDAGKKP